ncbi:Ig-like domain-containing protein, partial [Vibrio cholerae]|uniref:Ig-like domain-containing protein n=1 Tax=Vibrio cholerae TaxID=666 RepID=UPI00396707D8
AIATYSDGTSSDVTSSVTWTSVDTSTATVTSAGLLAGVDVGTTSVTATKDGVTSNTVNVDVKPAIVSIALTPATVDLVKGRTQQLTAIATYGDSTSSDVTSSVTWMSVDTSTATVTSAGLLAGVDMGTTSVTASKGGVMSNILNIKVLCKATESCIDITTSASGKYFTSSPSALFVDSMGIYKEAEELGFAKYSNSGANRLCSEYNAHNIGGRSNWRLPDRSELIDLHAEFGRMSDSRGWNTRLTYRTVTVYDANRNYGVQMESGHGQYAFSHSVQYNVSCVSNP